MTNDHCDDSGGTPFWTGELDYRLPPGAIAQSPAERREDSRLLVLDRGVGWKAHARFRELGRFLAPGALLVANDSRVMPARLRGHKEDSGGAVEALVLGLGSGGLAPAMLRSSKPVREGQVLLFPGGLRVRVAADAVQGRSLLDFGGVDVAAALSAAGEVPLPPYIERENGPSAEDLERYQTVYASRPGSVAAPTAGLHFTRALLDELAEAGFGFATVTLHVGPGTFTPVRTSLEEHEMDEEVWEIPDEAADAVNEARAAGRPVVAVGTTSVRALESAVGEDGRLRAGSGSTRLFIRPGHRFAVVDALLTNFHLPGSTLLALVMALAGRDPIRGAYEEAVREGYRFYSYGDAMLIR